MMKQVLVYGDSLSWGIIPGSRNRFAFNERWPGVMEIELVESGHEVRVIEDCLNGRRTVLEDPGKPGRNGLNGLQQRIEVNSPLALVVIVLGTNDFQSMHDFDALRSADGIRQLVESIRNAPIEPGMETPELLIVSPPPIEKALGAMAPKFINADTKSAGFEKAIEAIAVQQSCHFFAGGSVTSTSKVDGVHLDQDQHLVLGKGLARRVAQILG